MSCVAIYIVEVLLGDREAIRAAAIRFPDGTAYYAPFHADCYYQAYAEGKIKISPDHHQFYDLIQRYDIEEGFLTTKGRFVNRSEAFDIAQRNDQIPAEPPSEHDTSFLDSHDIEGKYK